MATLEQQQAIALAQARQRQAAASEQQERSTLEGVGRGVGLTARTALKSPGALADFVAGLVNVGIGGLSKAGEFIGDEPITARLPTSSAEFIGEQLTAAGLPVAETPLERVGGDIQSAALLAALPIKGGEFLRGAASPVTRGVGGTLAAGPALQGVSAVTGAGASGTVREAGGTPGQQTLAGLGGAFGPGLLKPLAQGAVRQTLRGGEQGRQALQENIETFGRAGTAPTLAQGTQGRIAQATESFLSRTPGGAGRIASTAQRQADDVAARVERIADDLSPKATAERAGRAIETGIKGFVERFKATSSRLYDDVDRHVDVNAPTQLSATRRFLSEKITPVAGAEETSQLLSSKFLDDVSRALDTDLQSALAQGVDGLPYSSIKALRSRVGEKLSNLSLIDDASKADLKRLYGALSDDLTTYVQGTNNPAASRAVTRANDFYRAGRNRIDNIESVVNKNGGPEKIFNAALSGTKEGATTLRTVMKSLQPNEQKMVAAAVVRRMGKATPGQQDVTGEAFSINTFLTNWARLSPEARGTLFGRFGPKFSKNMESLASFASSIRTGSRVFINPSGTQQAISLQTIGGGTVLASALGQFEIAAALAGTTVGSNLMSRLMTNPRFVNWLAAQSRIPAGSYSAQIQALTRMAADDRDIALAVGLLQEQQNQETNQNNGGQDQQ